MSFLKQKISFFSNFVSLFSVMRYKSSILLLADILYAFNKRASRNTNLVNFMWAVESLKFCTLMVLFALLSKLCKVSAKKVQNSYLSWHWKGDAKFKEKLTFGFKHDMRNLVNFHPTTPKSENFLSVGSFCP